MNSISITYQLRFNCKLIIFLTLNMIETKTNKIMRIGDKIEVNKIVCRELDVDDLVKLLTYNKTIFWSWGSHAFVNLGNKGLRFKVNGHHHKGHVYIVLNGSDLFDVYYTTIRGTIKDIHTDLYFDVLVETIDNKIERIEKYVM